MYHWCLDEPSYIVAGTMEEAGKNVEEREIVGVATTMEGGGIVMEVVEVDTKAVEVVATVVEKEAEDVV